MRSDPKQAAHGDRADEQLRLVAPALFAGLPKSHVLPAMICNWVPRRRAEWLALKAAKLDGGLARSLVLRRKLLKSSGVVLGAWSQGPGLIAGAFPPNSIIGRYCSIGPGVMVANENHPLDQYSTSGWFYDPICGLVAERHFPRGRSWPSDMTFGLARVCVLLHAFGALVTAP
jgi:hypothetical protein